MNTKISQPAVVHERSIGSIMLDLGLLLPEQIESVLRAQSEHGLAFGAAAIRLGLVTEDQLQQALFSQFDYPYLVRGVGEFSPYLVAAYEPDSPPVEVLRAIRGQLLLRWFTATQRALAIVSPDNGDGRSFITANLGVVFSQLGERTLLIDANLRAPNLHEFFKLDNRHGLSSVLAGMPRSDSIQAVPLLKKLSVLSAGPQPPNPGELLASPAFAELLDKVSGHYDIILIDTPAGLINSEIITLAARAGGALTVARKHCTRLNDLRQLSDAINEAGTKVIGNIFNEY